MLNRDYRELLHIFTEDNVRFLIVGAYAMAAHGFPRATGDLDIWVGASADNARKVYASLARFGAPLDKITDKTFTQEGIVFQIGLAPRRIDLMSSIDGVAFDNAYAGRQDISVEGLMLPFLSRSDLIRNKEATGRDKDRIDAASLKGQTDD